MLHPFRFATRRPDIVWTSWQTWSPQWRESRGARIHSLSRPGWLHWPRIDWRHVHWTRDILVTLAIIFAIAGLLMSALVGILFVPTHWPATNPITDAKPGVKHFYLALGDSLAFGFQPNFNWDQGYAEQWWPELQRHGSRSFFDYGCNGETTTQFIHGGCPHINLRHNFFSQPSQLDAALTFLHDYQGQVSPITIDEGADDLLPYVSVTNNHCYVNQAQWNQALQRLDSNMTQVILPKLVHAITVNGKRVADIYGMNYYNPYANICPNMSNFMRQLNQHLEHDYRMFSIPVADVYSAYGEANGPTHLICDYTWMCTGGLLHSIHPNTTGYGVITHTFEKLAGY